MQGQSAAAVKELACTCTILSLHFTTEYIPKLTLQFDIYSIFQPLFYSLTLVSELHCIFVQIRVMLIFIRTSFSKPSRIECVIITPKNEIFENTFF